jgi:hypothetical protein
MDPRVVSSLRLSFTGILVAGCQTPGESADQGCGTECDGSLPGPPTLVSARMDEQELVRLTFTEPLASVADVNPASFRISWAWYGMGYAGYDSYTAYYDPMLLLCLASDYCPGEYTDVIELSHAPDDPSSLLLRLDVFHPYICESIGYYADAPSPLLPHFDAGIATITDLDGEPLASISPEFVTAPDGYLEVDGNFPNYPMSIPIECP